MHRQKDLKSQNIVKIPGKLGEKWFNFVQIIDSLSGGILHGSMCLKFRVLFCPLNPNFLQLVYWYNCLYLYMISLK